MSKFNPVEYVERIRESDGEVIEMVTILSDQELSALFCSYGQWGRFTDIDSDNFDEVEFHNEIMRCIRRTATFRFFTRLEG